MTQPTTVVYDTGSDIDELADGIACVVARPAAVSDDSLLLFAAE
ncbi:MAG TPA: hypothetical protein VFA16_21510 [Mycobacterium sp.]|nr:hypothetical protein [Mycobacterium sp.]HZU49807.1 hypothetical protein [Mycobacterium sp.]